jgi:hypothetical protein
MKHLFSLLALFITLHLTGQSQYQSAQTYIKDLARFWSDPSIQNQLSESRSGQVITHKLDSVVTKNNVFATTLKTEMEYNSLGHTTKVNQYGIDPITFLLRLEAITTFEYQIPGYPSHILGEGINEETQVLEPQLEIDITYDGSNRIDSVVISLEDPFFGGGFGPFIGIQQIYDGDLLVQTRQWLFIALLGGWIPASITDFNYDNEDHLILQLSSSLDLETGELVPSDSIIYAYTVQGLLETETQYLWVDPVWEPTQLFHTTYHSNGTLSEEKRQIYNTISQTWDDNVLTLYPIENVNEIYPSSSYYWDIVTSNWYVTDSTVNLLNPALKWGQVAVPSQLGFLALLGGEGNVNYFDDPDGSSIDESRYFISDSVSLDLHFESQDMYYYSLFEGSHINTVLPEYIAVSPNPSNDLFTIDVDQQTKATYNIVNVTGVSVVKGNLVQGKNIIQTSGWTPGIYYVTMQLEDGTIYVHKQSVQ